MLSTVDKIYSFLSALNKFVFTFTLIFTFLFQVHEGFDKLEVLSC